MAGDGNEIFAGMGGDGMEVMRGWKRNWTVTGRHGNEICGDGCNFCPHVVL